MATHTTQGRGNGDGRHPEHPTERHSGERERSTQNFQNQNAFRYNRGSEGDQQWRPRDYSDDDYRFDNARELGYGERYGFAAYGKAHYDPNANREFQDPRERADMQRYNHTWKDDEPFTNREQDYRRHADSAGESRTRGRQAQRGENRGRAPKNYTRSDDRIREELCERLTHDSDVDPSDVEVIVTNGEVILRGTIDDRPMKRRAEDIADMVIGVKDVRNELRLSGLAMKQTASDKDVNASSDGQQHSNSQTASARGANKQSKTA